MVLGVPIFEHILIRLLCAQILGHQKIINFTFRTNEFLLFWGVPILRHFTVMNLIVKHYPYVIKEHECKVL